jgi:hypothetical protein
MITDVARGTIVLVDSPQTPVAIIAAMRTTEIAPMVNIRTAISLLP